MLWLKNLSKTIKSDISEEVPEYIKNLRNYSTPTTRNAQHSESEVPNSYESAYKKSTVRDSQQ